MQIGHLKMCVRNSQNKSFVVVQYFDPVLAGTTPVLNSQECPLLLLTNIFMSIPSKDVVASVSVLHECDNHCRLESKRKRQQIERLRDSLQLIHSNNMFLRNVYSIPI